MARRNNNTKKARTATTKRTRATNGARRTTRTTTNTNRNGQANRYNTITPFLAVSDANGALTWYKKALGAKEVSRMPGPNNMIMHAEFTVGDSRIFISDIFPGSSNKDPKETGPTGGLHVYSKDIQKIFEKAVKEGAEVVMPLDKQFWGDWYGQVVDPFGVMWSFGFPANMSEAEKKQKEREAMSQMAASVNG